MDTANQPPSSIPRGMSASLFRTRPSAFGGILRDACGAIRSVPETI
jgi:hypothetical protein